MVILRPQLARPRRAASAAAAPMALALAAARRAGSRGEVPVGAVVTDGAGAVLAVRGNRMRAAQDACAHAEMLSLAAALRRRPEGATPGRLEGCDLWVTLEPCAMCAAAAGLFRVRRVVFAAYDPKGGGVVHGARVYETITHAHQPQIVAGLCESAARAMLKDFFRDMRARNPVNEAPPDLTPDVSPDSTRSRNEE